ncbi:hypothetical protein NPIL_187741 [Nephila pilipes]|uniref:Uncharacterized protein n=1 Tax=Nephila pilipes TaxID=299642 RepID=A0A8X6ND60_NEPPI|nr:hypothetical protein NPIL_187741 [Nephila pilipes]
MSASCVTEPLVLLTESDGALTLKKSCKTYSSNSALDTHLNTHTEEKSDNVRNPVVKILASCVTKPLVPMTISKDDLTLRKSIKTYSSDCAVNTHTEEKSNVKNPVVKMPSSCVTEPLVLLSVPEDNLTLKKSRKTYSSNFAHNIETEENSLDNVLCDSDLASTSDLNKQNITHHQLIRTRVKPLICEFC